MLHRTKNILKQTIIRALTHPSVCTVFNPLTGCLGTVFMLHRFEDQARGVHGHSPKFVEKVLQLLRRRNFQLVSLKDLVASLDGSGDMIHHGVAFTFDDGTHDQAEIGMPLFTHYDCPVSVFLITGFMDKVLWPWDDQVAYLLRETVRNSLTMPFGDGTVSYELHSVAQRNFAIDDFRLRCKAIPELELEMAVKALSEVVDVPIPAKPPEGFAPMTWELARSLERNGLITFGPHSVSHKILPEMSDERARNEIAVSWQRLKEELAHPLPVFNFPTGIFGKRELDFLRMSGITNFVSSDAGYVHHRENHTGGDIPRKLDRFVFPETLEDFLQYSTWIEWGKEALRARIRKMGSADVASAIEGRHR
ncbi:MAG: polysaccharide deacetylase family protein [Acidiferrobacterales bacterium]